MGDVLGAATRSAATWRFSATSLPFNIAHAVGNVVFCLAFGPAFVRALLRFRERFEVRWEPVGRGAGGRWRSVLVAAAAPPARRAPAAAAYLISRPERATAASARRTGERSTPAVHGVGGDRASPRPGAATPRVAALPGAQARRGMRDVGDIERTILGLARRAPRRGARTGPTSWRACCGARSGATDRGTGSSTAPPSRCSRCARRTPAIARSARAARWLGGAGNRDGGFNFAGRGGPERDRRHRRRRAGARRGRPSPRPDRPPRGALPARRTRTPTAASRCSPGRRRTRSRPRGRSRRSSPPGRDPGARDARRGSRSPLAYLRSLTAGDGRVRYSRTSRQTPVWVTAQALDGASHRRAVPDAAAVI